METVYNFSAGPALLPKEVLIKAQAEMLNYKGTGMSIMEMSHRGSHFMKVLENAIESLKRLMQIPDNYEICFMHGGASYHFGMIPMNFLNFGDKAAYIDTGVWSSKAIAEAQKISQIDIIASSKDNHYNYIPVININDINKDYKYLHITTNNTIYGTCYNQIPDNTNIPVIADMSSDILSKHYDVKNFDMIYAGAQKNIGPAGVSIIIIKKDLLDSITQSNLPNIFNYNTLVHHHSLYHTPPTYSIYMCSLVLQWLEDMGGIPAIHKINIKKAQLLYEYLDQSTLFSNSVNKLDRSIMNVPFSTGDEVLDNAFIQFAEINQLQQLKGHRTNKGMRASIYNAMPIEGVKKLVEILNTFENKYKKMRS